MCVYLRNTDILKWLNAKIVTDVKTVFRIMYAYLKRMQNGLTFFTKRYWHNKTFNDKNVIESQVI